MEEFKKEIIEFLKKETKLKEIPLEVPPDPLMGDYAFPCFILSKKYKKSPNEIAENLKEKAPTDNLIESARAHGPYLNFFAKTEKIAESVLKKIYKEKEKYGLVKGKKMTYMVEYFHANTHKGVHIGHIRNISLGESLCRILEFNNNKVIRTNYFGDIGPHVAKCLWGYLNLKQKEPKKHKGVWLGKIYAIANKKAKAYPKIEEQIREINNKLYARDPALMKIWKKTRQWCYDDFDEIYKIFGFKFDRLYPESECEAPGKKVVQQLLKKGIAEKSEGAVIIDLKKYNLDVVVLLTKDGNALYPTKDLGMVMLKGKEFDVDKSIHVVGSEQEFYFKQLFRIFELMKHDYASKSLHLSYGLVMLPEGKMSSREGTMVLFGELKEELLSSAEKALKEKHKNLPAKEIKKRAKQIAYGALKFSMINRENNKAIVFDWERALDFEGETGPYIQYAYARICSILRRYNKEVNGKVNFNAVNKKEEIEIIKKIGLFPEIIEKAGNSLKPNILSTYVYFLAKSFNEFYHKRNILKEEEEVKKARLLMAYCVKQVIENSLRLLGIDAPENM